MSSGPAAPTVNGNALPLTPPDSIPSSPTMTKPPTSSETDSSASEFGGALTKTPTTSSKSYTSSLYSLADSLTTSISTISFPPLIAAARMAILGMMARSINYGRLRILTDQGVYTFPQDAGDATMSTTTAEIRVMRDTFWLRLVTLGDLGFAEAYMAGDCEVSDLVEVFKIFIRSRPELDPNSISGVTTLPSRLISMLTSLTNSRFANTISNSLSNIRAHYDLSNGMFSAFLSRDMTYSCGIYPELDADLKQGSAEGREGWNGGEGLVRINGAGKRVEGNHDGEGQEGTAEVDELEEAQLAKLRHIIKKADIQPGHRVLEIGSGWGSLAIEAVRSTNCTVDTITLSSQQKVLAEERIKAAGLAGRIRVWLMDYRALPESWKGQFDRVVSIEMLEAVGKDFIPGYFGVIDSVLNAKGVACIQVITIPESRFARYQQEVDFIRKWIFPGGFLPTVSLVTESIEKGSGGRLIIDSVSNIGPHYARTLREWRTRFLKTFEHRIRPALLSEHPEMSLEDVEVFKRKWLYYFCYCEVGFSERVIGDHIFTMMRDGVAEYGCQVYV